MSNEEWNSFKDSGFTSGILERLNVTKKLEMRNGKQSKWKNQLPTMHNRKDYALIPLTNNYTIPLNPTYSYTTHESFHRRVPL